MNYIDSGLGQSGESRSADLVLSGDNAKVALPPSFNLATVQFDRQGPDLEITSADGKTILVTNYFSGGSSTKINLPNGVELPGHIVTKLAGPVASHNQLAQAVDAALSEPIGKVETASGQVFAVRADGTKVALKVGDNVFQGDELVTEGGASVGVVFADETTFALGEDGRMILDEMVYDPGAQDGAIGLTLLSGAMTFVSGAVSKVNPDAMEITTPVATIGIRGTAGILKVLNGQTDAALLPELAKGDVDPNQQGGDGTVIGEFDVINNITGDRVTLNQPFQGVSGTASGNSAVTVLNPQQIAGLAGNTVAALPGSENLLPPSVQNAVSGGENGQQSTIAPQEVLVDQDTADALEGIFTQVQTVQGNLFASSQDAKDTINDIINTPIPDPIIPVDPYANMVADLTSISSATATYTTTAASLETLASNNKGTSTIEDAAATISADWDASTTNSIEDSVDNVMEAYATANAIGSVAAGVTAFAEVVGNSLGSLVNPQAAVTALQSAQAYLGSALNEAGNILNAMVTSYDETSSSAYQNMSVQERMIQAVIQAAKDVKDAGGTDAAAITAARNAIVSGGNFTVNGVQYTYNGLQTELNAALTHFGHPNALTNLDGYISDLNSLFVSMKNMDFTNDAGGDKLAAWNTFVDEMVSLTDYANTAATQAKSVIQAADIDSMDTAATQANAAMQDANTKVTSAAFDTVKSGLTTLVVAEAPNSALVALGTISNNALQAEIDNAIGKVTVLNSFDRSTINTNESLAAGDHVTQANIDAVTSKLTTAQTALSTVKGLLATAQTAYDSSVSTLNTASNNVLTALLNWSREDAKATVYTNGANTILNGDGNYGADDGSNIDGLNEAKGFLSGKESALVTAQADYDAAVAALNADPTNVTSARAVLVAEQTVGALKTIITYAGELVDLWQDGYNQINALATSVRSNADDLLVILNNAKTIEADARVEVLSDLNDLILAQGGVADQSQAVAVFESQLSILETRAEKEAIADLNDVLGDARTELDVALAQAELAAQKAAAAAAEVDKAKLADDASSFLTNAQALAAEAKTAADNAQAAYNKFTTDVDANDANDNIYARAIAIRDYPRPPADLETTLTNIDQLLNSAQSAANEAILQSNTAAGSVQIIQAIVDGDAAAQAAAESTAVSNLAAANAQAIAASLEKAQAAQNEITSAIQTAEDLNTNAQLIAQKGAGTSAANASLTNANNVEADFLAIQGKQSLVNAEVQSVTDAQTANDLTAARTHAATAQDLATDVKALLSGGTLSDGSTVVTGISVSNQTAGKAVIDAISTDMGTRTLNADGTVSARTGLVASAHTQKTTAEAQYNIVKELETDTDDASVESVTEIFSVGSGESIVSTILGFTISANEISEYQSGGTAYESIVEKLAALKVASANALTAATDAKNLALGYVDDAQGLVTDARLVLNAAQLSGNDFDTYSASVKKLGAISGLIQNNQGDASAAVQHITQIDNSIELYKNLWEARVQTAIQSESDRVAAQTAADQAATDASNAAAERTAQKAADDDAATTQAQGFETTAAQQKALAATALANAQEAAINGDETSAQSYLELVQKYASASLGAAQAASNAAAGHGTAAETAASNARDSGFAAQGYLGDAKAAVVTAADSATSANNWRSGSATQAALQATSDKDEAVTNESNARTNLTNATTSLENARTAVSNAEIKAASAQAAYNSLVDAKKAAADKAAAVLAEVGSDSPIYQAWASAAEAASDAADSALSASQDAAQALTDANSRLSVVQSSYDRALEAATNASEQLADAVSNEAYASSLEDLGRAVSEAQVDTSLSSAQSSLDTALTNLASEKTTVEQKAALAAQHAQDDANFDADIVQNAYDDPNSTNDAVGSLADAQTAKASADAALVVAQNALAKYYVDLSVIKSANDPNVAIDGGSIVDFASYTNQDWVRIDDTTVISGSTYDKYVAAQASIELASKKADQAADALQTVEIKVQEIAQSLAKAQAIQAEQVLASEGDLTKAQTAASAALERAEKAAEEAVDSTHSAINAADKAMEGLETIVGSGHGNADLTTAVDNLNTALTKITAMQASADGWGTTEVSAPISDINQLIADFGSVTNGGDDDLFTLIQDAYNAITTVVGQDLGSTFANDAADQVQAALASVLNAAADGGAIVSALGAVNSLKTAFEQEAIAQAATTSGVDTTPADGVDDGIAAGLQAAQQTAAAASQAASQAATVTGFGATAQGARQSVSDILADKALADADNTARTAVESDLTKIVAAAVKADTAADDADTAKTAAINSHATAQQELTSTQNHLAQIEAKAQFAEDAPEVISDFSITDGDKLVLENASHLTFVETPYTYTNSVADTRAAIDGDSSIAVGSLVQFSDGSDTYIYAKFTSADPYKDFFVTLDGFTETLTPSQLELITGSTKTRVFDLDGGNTVTGTGDTDAIDGLDGADTVSGAGGGDDFVYHGFTDLSSKATILDSLAKAQSAVASATTAVANALAAKVSATTAATNARDAADAALAQAKAAFEIIDDEVNNGSTDFSNYTLSNYQTYLAGFNKADLDSSFFRDDASTANVNESDVDGDGISNAKEISNALKGANENASTATTQKTLAEKHQATAATEATNAAAVDDKAATLETTATTNRTTFDLTEEVSSHLVKADVYAGEVDDASSEAATAATNAKTYATAASDASVLGDVDTATTAAQNAATQQAAAETAEATAFSNLSNAYKALIEAFDVVGDTANINSSSELTNVWNPSGANTGTAFGDLQTAMTTHAALDAGDTGTAYSAELTAYNTLKSEYETLVSSIKTALTNNANATDLQKELVLRVEEDVADALDAMKATLVSHSAASNSMFNANLAVTNANDAAAARQTAVEGYEADADQAADNADRAATKAELAHDDNNAATKNDAVDIASSINTKTSTISSNVDALLSGDLAANQDVIVANLGQAAYDNLVTQLNALKTQVTTLDNGVASLVNQVETASTEARAAATAAQTAANQSFTSYEAADVTSAKAYAEAAQTSASEAENKAQIALATTSNLARIQGDVGALENGYTSLASLVQSKIDLAQDTASANADVIATDDAVDATEDTALVLDDLLLANDAKVDGSKDGLVITGFKVPSDSGTITVNRDGQHVYTPKADFSGTVVLTYYISNGQTGVNERTASANVTLTIDPVNDNPITVTDYATTPNESAPVTIGLLQNDVNVDAGDTLTVTAVDFTGAKGTVTILDGGVGGRVTYTPVQSEFAALGAGETETVSFTYTVTDSGGLSATGTAYVTITGTNDVPTVSNTSVTMDEGAAHTFSAAEFEAGYSDVEGESLTHIQITQLPSKTVTDTAGNSYLDANVGTLKLNGSDVSLFQKIAVADIANLVFTPSDTFSGTLTLKWKGAETYLDSNDVPQQLFSDTDATMTFTVNAVNDAPTGSATLFGNGGEDTVITGSMSVTDEDGDTLTYTLDTESLPQYGTVVVNSTTGEYTYTPNGDYNGTDSFFVDVEDGNGGLFSQEVKLTVNAVNDAPTNITLDNLNVNEAADGAVIGTLSTADVDTGDSFTYTVSDARFEVDAPTGDLKLKSGYKLNYETEPTVTLTVTSTDAGGSSFDKEFTIAVNDINEAPTDVSLSSLAIAEGVAGAEVGSISVVDQDAGETFTYTVSDSRFEVVDGVLKLKDSETLDAESETTVSVDVDVMDSAGNSLSQVKTFTLQVSDTNDEAPVLGGATTSVAYTEDGAPTPVFGALSVTDGDAVPTMASATIQVTNLQPGDFLGFDSAEATTNNISGLYNATTGVLTLTADSGATVTPTQFQSVINTITYETTVENPSGVDRVIQVTVNDGVADSAPQQVTVAVTPVNDAPIVTDAAVVADLNIMVEDTPDPVGTLVSDIISQLDGASDYEGDSLGIAVTDSLTLMDSWQYYNDTSNQWVDMSMASDNAAVLLDANTRVRYMPEGDFSGSKSFQFHLWDGTQGTNQSTYDITSNGGFGGTTAFGADLLTSTIEVTPVNDAPALSEGGAIAVMFGEDGSAQSLFNLDSVGVYDVDGDTVTSATVTITNVKADDELLFTPQNGITGTYDSVTGVLTLTDSGNAATNSDFTDVINSVQFFNASQNMDASTRNIEVVVSDGLLNSMSLSANVNIFTINDAPIVSDPGVVPDLSVIGEDQIDSAGTLVSDILLQLDASDYEGDPLGIAVIDTPNTNGIWQYYRDATSEWTDMSGRSDGSAKLLDSNSLVRFVPNADYNGTEVLQFRLWDGTEGTNQELYDITTNGGAGGTNAFGTDVLNANIEVTPVNDAPDITETPELVTNTITPGTAAATTDDFMRVESHADGSYGVFWLQNIGGYDQVVGRLYDSNADPIGDQFVINDGSLSTQSMGFLDVAVSDDGGYMVSYDGGGAINVTPVTSNGTMAATFQLASSTSYKPSLTSLGDVQGDGKEEFVLISRDPSASSNEGMTIQVFSEDGTIVSGPTLKAQGDIGSWQVAQDVINLGNGRFAALYGDQNGGSWDYDYSVFDYNNLASPVLTEKWLVANSGSLSATPGDATAAFAWSTGTEIQIAILNSDGTLASAPPIQVNTSTIDAGEPGISQMPDGSWVVVYKAPDGSGGYDILGQRVGSNGNLIGEEFQLNQVSGENLNYPQISANAEGEFVVTWQDTTSNEIEQRIFTVEGTDTPVPLKVIMGTEDTPLVFNESDLISYFSDVDGDSLSVVDVSLDGVSITPVNGEYSVTPAQDFYGKLPLEVTVSDGTVSTTGTFIVKFEVVNDAPLDSGTLLTSINKGDAGIIITEADLLANVSDADGDTLTVSNVTIVTAGSHTLTGPVNGEWTFTPDATFSGFVEFSYDVSDGVNTITATAQQPVSGPPTDIILAPEATISENDAGAIIGELSATDPDVGDTHTFTVLDERFEIVGTQLKLKDGVSLDYEASGGYGSVNVEVTDALGGTFSKTVSFTIQDTNDAPVMFDNGGEAGAIGTSFNTSGGTAYMAAETPSVVTNNFTMEMLFKWDGTTTANRQILAINGDVNAGYEISLDVDGNGHDSLIVNLYGSSGDTFYFDVAAMPSNEWTHVAMVRDAGTLKVYMDGVELTDFTTASGDNDLTVAPDAPTAGFTIGNGDDMMSPFKGNIDEVRIWETARTQTQILDNMTSQIDPDDTALAARYTFDDLDTSGVYDEGNLNGTTNGTLYMNDAVTSQAHSSYSSPVSDAISINVNDGDAGYTGFNLSVYAIQEPDSADVANIMTATYTVNHGVFKNDVMGNGQIGASLTVSGLDTNTLTLSGTAADIQAYIGDPGYNVEFVPDQNYNGTALMTVSLTDGTDTNGYTFPIKVGFVDEGLSILGTANADSIMGGDGDDTLVSNSANDFVDGKRGDDTLVSATAAGNMTLVGGVGNDYFDIQTQGGNTVYGEELYPGNPMPSIYPTDAEIDYDILSYKQSDDGQGVYVDVDFGTVSGSGGIDTFSDIDYVIGTTYDDTFIGDANNNVFTGMAGTDTFDGGAGSDEIRYDKEDGANGVTVNLETDTFVDTYGNTETATSFERIRGSMKADTITGSDTSDPTGSSDYERISGMAGNDTLDGGGGDDDELSYSSDIAGVTVNLGTGSATDGWGDSDTISNFEHVRGSMFNDTITGYNTGTETYNIYYGLAGDDTFNGLGGTLNFDVVSYDKDIWYGSVNGIYVSANTDSTVHTVTDGFGDTDTLNNIDRIHGTLFDDTFIGGSGVDSFRGFAGDDYFDGGAGDYDEIDYRGTSETSGVIVDLANGTATDQYGHTDTLLNVERVRGSYYSDAIMGNDAANRLRGYDGDDSLVGGLGDDTLDGGTGIDWLQGDAGADIFNYNSWTDSDLNNYDTIADFEDGVDTINLNGAAGYSYGYQGFGDFMDISSAVAAMSADSATDNIYFFTVDGSGYLHVKGSGSGTTDYNGTTIELYGVTTPISLSSFSTGVSAQNYAPQVLGMSQEINAIVFDGVDDIIDAGRGVGDSFDIATDLTIESWIKVDDFSNTPTLIRFGGDGELASQNIVYQLYIDATGDVHYFHEYGAGVNVDLAFDTNLATNEWHHLSMVRDYNDAGQSTVELFMDGVSVGTQTFELTEAPESAIDATLRLGAAEPGVASFNGSVADVRIWSEVRTPEQIVGNYDRVLTQPGTETNLEAYWTFDEVGDEKEYVVDHSSNGNHIRSFDSLTFDGVDDYAVVSNSTILMDHSASAWINTSEGGSIISGTNGTDQYFNMAIDGSGQLMIDIQSTAGGKQYTTTGLNLSDGAWHNVGYSMDALTSTLTLFLDGQEISAGNIVFNVNTPIIDLNVNTSTLNLGADTSGNANFDGKISEVALFKDSLTSIDFTTIYENGVDSVSAVKAGHWRFDNGEGSVITNDYYGADLGDATIVGMTGGAETWNTPTPVINSFGDASVHMDGTGLLNLGPITAPSGDISISAWINPDNLTTDQSIFDLGSGNFEFKLNASGQLELSLSNGTDVLTADYCGNTGEWQFVTVTYNATSGQATIYINDEQANSGNLGQHDFSGVANSTVLVNGFQGGVGEIQYWSKELTEGEVIAHKDAVLDGNETDLTSYWIFDQDSGNVVTDLTGAHDGTFNTGYAWQPALPKLVGDGLVVVEDQTTYSRLVVDDLEGDAVTYSVLTNPMYGTLVLEADGSFAYTPNINYLGNDSFALTVTDAEGNSTNYYSNFTIIAQNADPIATYDQLSTAMDTSITFSVADLIANDSDQDGDSINVINVFNPSNGTIVDNGDTTWTYTPNAGYTGIENLDYTLSDGMGGEDVGYIQLAVGVAVTSTITGTAGADTLAGTADNNVIFADGGDDIISGSMGNDSIDGSAGSDTLDYSSMTDAVNAYFSIGVVDKGSNGTDSVSNVESLVGTDFSDSFIGDASDNFVNARGGDDTIDGGDGNDSLLGGAGNDLIMGASGNDILDAADGDDDLFGGLGADTLTTGNGNDIIMFFGSEDSDTTTTDTITDYDPTLDTLVLENGGHLSFHADLGDLSGQGSLTAIIAYIEGNGTVPTGSLVTFNDTTDTYVYAKTDSVNDAYNNFLVHFSGLPVLTAGDFTLAGNGAAPIEGTAANDTLTGTALDDEILGLAGDDVLIGDSGFDLLFGGDGTDTAYFNNAPANYTFSTEGAAIKVMDDHVSGDDEDILINVEQAYFNANGLTADQRTYSISQKSQELVNATTPNTQVAPDVAGLYYGGYVVVYNGVNNTTSDNEVYFRIYDEDGTAGAETVFSTISTYANDSARVSALNNGGFVITWAQGSASNSFDVYGIVYNWDGTPNTAFNAGAAFLIDTTQQTNAQDTVRVASLQDGGFITTWSEQVGGDYNIVAKRYYADGSDGGELVIANTANSETGAEVIGMNDGGYAIIWQEFNGSNVSVKMSVYSSNGSLVTSNIVVDANSIDNIISRDITVLNDGSIAVVSVSDKTGDGNTDAFLTVYNSTGTAPIGPIVVNSDGSNVATDASVTALSNGDLVVIWREVGTDTDQGGIFGKIYDAYGGSKTLDSFLINDLVTGDQTMPRVSAIDNWDSDGGFVVVWESDDEAGSRGIYKQTFDNNGQILGGLTITGTSDADIIHGGAGVQVIDGGAGNDSLFGGDGADTFIASAGTDLMEGGDGATDTDRDLVAYSNLVSSDGGTDVTGVTINLSTSLASGDGIDQDGNSVADTNHVFSHTLYNIEDVIGSSLNDTITGSGGTNTVYAGDGDDVVDVGAGDDLVFASTGDDVINGGLGMDWISFDTGFSSVGISFDMGNTSAQSISTDFGTDTISGFENVEGTIYNDLITGDANDNFIDGMEGVDTLNGGDGNDILIGGMEADILTGGNGADIFIFDDIGDVWSNTTGTNVADIITDFVSGTDTLQIDRFGFDGMSELTDGALLAANFETYATLPADVGITNAGPTFLFIDDGVADANNTALYYDADGSGTNYQSTKIAEFSNDAVITKDDILLVSG